MFVITVPHSLCRPGNNADHSCDSSAVELAGYIAACLGDSAVGPILADKNRTQCDLNRSGCGSTVKQRMLAALVPGVILLDVHSYPHGEKTDNTVFAKGSAAFKLNAWSCDLFFIVPDEQSLVFFKKIYKSVREALPRYDVRGFKGNRKLDLIHEGSKRGLPSVLIEAGEHLTPAQLKELGEAIARAVKNEKSMADK